MARVRTDWLALVKEAGRINRKLKRKPRHLKAGYWFNPGSILKAFLEGDLTFKKAVAALNRWKRHTPNS